MWCSGPQQAAHRRIRRAGRATEVLEQRAEGATEEEES